MICKRGSPVQAERSEGLAQQVLEFADLKVLSLRPADPELRRR